MCLRKIISSGEVEQVAVRVDYFFESSSICSFVMEDEHFYLQPFPTIAIGF